MFKKLMIISFLVIFITLNTIDVTIVGDENYPPYSYSDNGKPAGIYTDILLTIFSQMEDFEVTIKLQPWKRALNDIKNSKAFAIFPPYYRPLERPFIDPYSDPILSEKVAVLCIKESGLDIHSKWPEDFFGKRIGMNLGFSLKMGGEEFIKAVDEGKIIIDYADSNEMNLKKLQYRRIDAYLNDKLSIIWTVKKLGIINCEFTIDGFEWGPVTSNENGYLGYSENSKKFIYKADFIRQFNTILQKLKDSGEIEKILSKYLE